MAQMKIAQPSSAASLSLRFLGAPKLDNILVPVDFSSATVPGILAALTLLKGNPNASLTLVHVVEPMTAGDFVDAGLLSSVATEQRLDAAEEMMAHLKLNFGENIRITTRLVTGNPIWMLSGMASGGEYDLIAMTSHGRSGLKRAFLGSVAEGVIHRAHCPVLVVKLRHEAGETAQTVQSVTWKRILVGFDHRLGSIGALGFAGRVAEATHASISLMNALSPQRHVITAIDDEEGDETRVAEEIARLEEVKLSYFPLSADWDVAAAIGEPWDVLSERAAETHADLIVVGPHNHVLRARDFIGSTAQRMVRLAPCSVLAVK
ncbi:MAG: universal stress protein [Verrucomicrobiaceae bacterium]|nr:MAG: universal stress protein [Verrucomicrobiaceae bacterium]